MLILSRRIDESINIGDDVVVTVLEVKGKQVRLGVTAPDDVTILREEVAGRDPKPETLENRAARSAS